MSWIGLALAFSALAGGSLEPAAPAWEGATVHTEPAALQQLARNTLAYLEAHGERDPRGVHAGRLAEHGVTTDDLRATLRTIVDAEPAQLSDPAWLARTFRYVRWRSDEAAAAEHGVALDDGRVRLTKYLVYRLQGSPVRTERFSHALYAVPRDEAALTPAEALDQRERLDRFRFTRQEVLSGAYEPGGPAEGGAEALVWLERSGVHDAIMQGTVEVVLPDGETRVFNVDRGNEIPYDRSIRDPEQQARYWYFREREGVAGWGWHPDHKVALVPGVSVAGDVGALGLGTLLALEGPGDALRLVILADTGGAFEDNLYQLDLLVGTFPSRAAFDQAVRDLPRDVEAGFLVVER